MRSINSVAILGPFKLCETCQLDLEHGVQSALAECGRGIAWAILKLTSVVVLLTPGAVVV